MSGDEQMSGPGPPGPPAVRAEVLCSSRPCQRSRLRLFPCRVVVVVVACRSFCPPVVAAARDPLGLATAPLPSSNLSLLLASSPPPAPRFACFCFPQGGWICPPRPAPAVGGGSFGCVHIELSPRGRGRSGLDFEARPLCSSLLSLLLPSSSFLLLLPHPSPPLCEVFTASQALLHSMSRGCNAVADRGPRTRGAIVACCL